MEIVLRFSIVILAMILCQSAYAFSALSAYERMQCVFYSQNDFPESCLLGHKRTICGAIKCLKTIGQPCSISSHELKLTGNECASTLVCGCDRKCNGCMTVNGKEECYFANKCMPLHKRGGGARGGVLIEQVMPPSPESYEFAEETNGMVNTFP